MNVVVVDKHVFNEESIFHLLDFKYLKLISNIPDVGRNSILINIHKNYCFANDIRLLM